MTAAAFLRSRARSEDDGGFALLFVLFVTVMVLLATTSMLVVTAGTIGPAKQSQDDYAATAAAQSGIQDFVANLNANCAGSSVQTCAWLTSAALTGRPAPDSDQSYSTRALNPTNYLSGNDGTVRVTSTGYVGGSSNRRATKTLVADISSKPNLLRFAYFSNYETLAKSFLDAYYPARTITLSDSAVASAVGLPTNSTVTWQGTATAPQNGYTDDICDALHYQAAGNPASIATGRAAARQVRSALPRATDFSEDGATRAKTPLGYAAPVSWTRFAPCEATFTKGMVFNGPVYSRDALYLSNGEWGASTGPSFTVPAREPLPAVSTGWSVNSSPAVADATKPYRSDAVLGGTPTTTATGAGQLVTTYPQTLSLPSTATPTGDDRCVFAGPTRIVLAGTSAYVSGTPAAATPAGCYVKDATTGAYKVPINSTTIQVKTGGVAASSTLRFPAVGSVAALDLGAGGDITSYSATADDVYIEGALTAGKLSIVAGHDIVATGNVLTTSTTGSNGYGETSWSSGGAIDLVAGNDVRVHHPVACRSGSASAGYCPNDASGLFAPSAAGGALSPSQLGTIVGDTGTLRATHPALQYCNVVGTAADCDSDLSGRTRTIQAAVIALNGSLRTDNFNRGTALGSLHVDGGVYVNHRGPAGQQWEIPTATSTRQNSGYKLGINYVSYANAGLPYVPVLDQIGTDVKAWYVLTVSTGTS